MSLGEKLRLARQEAGLSQRALCGDAITRNMLSQIENGTAKPSMATLQYLAGRLQKPVSYFLGEAAAESSPLARLVLALEQAKSAAEVDILWEQCIDAPAWIRRQAVLRKTQWDPESTLHLVPQLPELDTELLLRARAALSEGQIQRAINCLNACENRDPAWQLAMGEALLLQKNYAQAAHHFHQAEEHYPHRTSEALEVCYRELEDYQKAYHYACRVRNLSGR